MEDNVKFIMLNNNEIVQKESIKHIRLKKYCVFSADIDAMIMHLELVRKKLARKKWYSITSAIEYESISILINSLDDARSNSIHQIVDNNVKWFILTNGGFTYRGLIKHYPNLVFKTKYRFDANIFTGSENMVITIPKYFDTEEDAKEFISTYFDVEIVVK